MPAPPALDGISVIDFSTVGPAARCSRILADYGARVIKVGAPPKQGGVQIEPPYYAYSAHRGMQRARIDLKAPEGRAAALKLAGGADVILESFRPGVADRLGIGYAEVRRVNPRIVYCSTSGYGQDGPHAGWAGHDLNYLAVAGFLYCTGRRADGGPPLPGATLADSAGGGMHAAVAILAALLRRGHSGEGEYLDVAVAEGVLSLMSLSVDQHLATGEEPGPGHDILTGRYACYDVYRARDGRWLAVAAIEPAFYANLCRALGLEEWIPSQKDDERQEEIRAAFREAFARRDRDEWVAALAPADTCVAPVHSIGEAVRDPHFEARGAFAEARHARHGRFRQVGPVLAGMPRARTAAEVRDASVTDTEALLHDAGLSAEEIETMRSQGVVA
ncbi:MAG: CoA transferase [Myxococcales bacterium]|nr:CoA transferase [Myxococcales bacterium]